SAEGHALNAAAAPLPQDSAREWLAPRALQPVTGRIRVPASKSLTNPYLRLAAIASGRSVVVNPLDSRDSQLMLGALSALGAQVEHISDWQATGEPAVRISPIGSAQTHQQSAEVDCGLAGTVMRFVPPVAALSGREVRFDG